MGGMPSQGASSPGMSIRVRLRGAEKDVMAGYYVNVSEASYRIPALGHLIEDLRQALAGK